MRRYLLAALFATLALAACEGSRNNSSWSKAKPDAEVVPPLKTNTAAADTSRADSASTDSSQAKH
jgi:nitrous oxide reductase accessory protein NosL